MRWGEEQDIQEKNPNNTQQSTQQHSGTERRKWKQAGETIKHWQTCDSASSVFDINCTYTFNPVKPERSNSCQKNLILVFFSSYPNIWQNILCDAFDAHFIKGLKNNTGSLHEVILKNLSNLWGTFVEGYLRGQGMLNCWNLAFIFHMWKICHSNHNIMKYHFNLVGCDLLWLVCGAKLSSKAD